MSNGKAAICLTSLFSFEWERLITRFSHSSFADSAIGGDLRFFDEQNRELIHEIDEWNSSGETTAWVQVKDLGENSKVFAYWGMQRK